MKNESEKLFLAGAALLSGAVSIFLLARMMKPAARQKIRRHMSGLLSGIGEMASDVCPWMH